MSIASNFRAKMDVALASADKTRGMGDDYRRTMLSKALDEHELMLCEKAYVTALFEAIQSKSGEPS